MSKLFSVDQCRAWDQYTITHEPVASIDLMERAAKACVACLKMKWLSPETIYCIFCGNGNNGGDGLAIARLLLNQGCHVRVFLSGRQRRSDENAANLNELLSLYPSCVREFTNEEGLPHCAVVIDALYGTGLNRPVSDTELHMINYMNTCGHPIVSIDIPSGLSGDFLNPTGAIVKADYTLTFQQYKPSFLYPETGMYCGEVKVIDIHLNSDFAETEDTDRFIIDQVMVRSLYQKRTPFSHKGTYGHALMVCGSHGKMGAAVLAAKACVRSGAGLVTACMPAIENVIMQMAVPEVMTMSQTDMPELLSNRHFDAIGIGCGLGTDNAAVSLVDKILTIATAPLMLDADALNTIALQPDWLSRIPAGSLLTPHPKEFDRLFGACDTSFERNRIQIEMSKQHSLYILLKGRYTSISTPDGHCYYNITGNAGMATGGSGDVLTGIITGLYAQYKDMKTAALKGVYLHGLAGDLATRNRSQEGLIASDIIDSLGEAFLKAFY